MGNRQHDSSSPRMPFNSQLLGRAWGFLSRGVWLYDLDQISRGRALLIKSCRVGFLTVRGFFQDRIFFRSSALTYITAISIVPLLAIMFAIAKAFGLLDELKEEFIVPFIEDLGGTVSAVEGAEQVPAATAPSGGETQSVATAVEYIVEAVEQTDVGGIGLVSLGVLLFVIIKLLGTIERSFNEIWGVQKSRSFVRKFADYLAMVIIAPIFVVAAISLQSAFQIESVVERVEKNLQVEWVVGLLGSFVPVTAMWIVLTFIYVALPNTRTRVSSAAIGAFVGSILWNVFNRLHVHFQLGVARYNEIYAAFAAIPIFFAWIQASWVTVLIGAELAFAHQSEPAYRQIARSRPSDHAFREIVALRAMLRVCVAFLRGEEPLATSDLSASLGVPPRPVEEVMGTLALRRLVTATEGYDEERFVPARDPSSITIKSVLDALKGTSGPVDVPAQGPMDEELDRLLGYLNEEAESSPRNRNLRELAVEAERGVEIVEALAAREARPRQA